MQYPWLYDELIQKPGAAQDFKEEWQWTRFQVGGKLFAAICKDETGQDALLTLKLEPQEGCWTTEFKDYLMQRTLPDKEEDTKRVARKAMTYCIQDGELYRKRPNDVSLHCISREQGKSAWN